MLYIDQPISVGFSYGDNSVDTTASAAPIVWKLLQAFHAKFPQYQSRDFGIFTESYGGHYGPGFSKYILDQNDAIDKGTVTGQKINLIALGINNGWINPYHNYKGIIDFSVDNEYKKLITKDRATTYYSKLDKTCLPLLQKCWKDNTNSACAKSVMTCSSTIESPITRSANFSAYDVRRGSSGKWPPMTYEKFLQKPGIQKAIGATRKYSECPDSVHMRFTRTGDGKVSWRCI
jgi:carboxypeptidase D